MTEAEKRAYDAMALHTGEARRCRVSGPKIAMVDESGKFHCPCGASHSRGAVNGVDAYRCLKCGNTYRVRGVAELRKRPDDTAGRSVERVARELADRFPEINPANYNDDDVQSLNAWGIEAYAALRSVAGRSEQKGGDT